MKIDFGFHSKGSPQFAFKHLDFTDGQGRGRALPSYRGRGEKKRGKDWVKEGFSNTNLQMLLITLASLTPTPYSPTSGFRNSIRMNKEHHRLLFYHSNCDNQKVILFFLARLLEYNKIFPSFLFEGG